MECLRTSNHDDYFKTLASVVYQLTDFLDIYSFTLNVNCIDFVIYILKYNAHSGTWQIVYFLTVQNGDHDHRAPLAVALL